MADQVNHRVLLAQRPDGLVRDEDFAHDEVAVPEPGDGEVLVRTEWLGIDATVRLRDPVTGPETLTLTGPRCQINGLAFDPDGQTLAAACHDGRIRLWRGGPWVKTLPLRE